MFVKFWRKVHIILIMLRFDVWLLKKCVTLVWHNGDICYHLPKGNIFLLKNFQVQIDSVMFLHISVILKISNLR